MLTPIEGTKNGYHMDEKATNSELVAVYNKHDKVNCLVMNAKTRAKFSSGKVTINNRAGDDDIYINSLN